MQAFLTDRARGPWWLAAALVVVLLALWQPWADDAVVPVPAPAPAIAEHVPAPELNSRAPAPIEVAPPTPTLKLVGTVVAGASSFATMRRTTDSQLLQLRVGDRVDGLAVTAIESGRVVLAGAAMSVVIEADRTAPVSASPGLSREASPRPASQVESPAWAEGEAPWDLAPPFRH